MAAGQNTALAGTVASGVINSLTNTHATSSTATTALQGLLANLMLSRTDAGRKAICTQIMMTPNAGQAGQLAEALLEDLDLPIGPSRDLAIMRDLNYLQATVNTMSHQTGILSSFLAGLGL